MELILLLKQEKYFADSFEIDNKKELLEMLEKINYKNGVIDEYEIQKIVKDKEVNEKLEFSIHIKENDKMYSIENYLKK
jgi:ribosome-binding protein aMBF1 (putative translation factor)